MFANITNLKSKKMKKVILFVAVIFAASFASCKKDMLVNVVLEVFQRQGLPSKTQRKTLMINVLPKRLVALHVKLKNNSKNLLGLKGV